MSNKSRFKGTLLATAVVASLALGATSASAGLLNAWQFNPPAGTGVTNVDHIEVTGTATVLQNFAAAGTSGCPVTNSCPNGQTFSESGFLQMAGYKIEPGNGAFLPLNFGAGLIGYLSFPNLTGTFSGQGTAADPGSISFDPMLNAVQLVTDTDTNPSNGITQVLATYNLIMGGGQGLAFFGGAGPNGTIDVTLQIATSVPGLFKDSGGNPLDPPSLVLHLVNVNALLDPNFFPNPTPVGPGGGVSTLHVQNAGQYNLATAVPEPASVALLGMGLAALGAIRRRKVEG